MKKVFLLYALCIFSIFNLQSNDSEDTQKAHISGNLYVHFSTDFMPYAQRWFEELKIKYAQAGFDEITFLREGSYIINKKETPSGWMACYHTHLNKTIKSNFNNLKAIKLIFASREDLEKLNKICQIYYENPKKLSLEDKKYLNRVTGLLLHEIYHCLSQSKNTFSSFAFNFNMAMSTNILFYKVYDLYAKRSEEYKADMHALHHGTAEDIEGLISFFKETHESYKKAGLKKLDPAISKLESLQKQHWNVLKAPYITAIAILKGAQSIQIDHDHPSIENRIRYLSEALEHSKR